MLSNKELLMFYIKARAITCGQSLPSRNNCATIDSINPLHTQVMLVQKSKLLNCTNVACRTTGLLRSIVAQFDGKVTRCDGSQTAAYVRRGSTEYVVNAYIVYGGKVTSLF